MCLTCTARLIWGAAEARRCVTLCGIAMTCSMTGRHLQSLATGGAVKAAKMLLNAAWHVAHLKRLAQRGCRQGRGPTACCAGTAGRCLLGWRPCQPLQQPPELAAVVCHAGEQLPQLCQEGPKALQAGTACDGRFCTPHTAPEGRPQAVCRPPAWNGCSGQSNQCHSCARRGLQPSEHRQRGDTWAAKSKIGLMSHAPHPPFNIPHVL